MIRPATRRDVTFDTYGKSLRAIACEYDGRVIGITGVIHTSPLQCFAELGDEIRSRPKVLVKFANALKEILDSYNSAIYVVADKKIEASDRFLEHIGFEKVEGEELYKWPQ